MQAAQAQDKYWHPNSHLLASLAAASARRAITAAHDIIDVDGSKLWARGQAVSQALQQKLLERRLLRPIESCLHIEDGVTNQTLARSMHELLRSPSPLAGLVAPRAEVLERELGNLPLHPVVQLLASTAHESRPRWYAHAVAAMTLAGALAAGAGWARYDLRLAMLGGLLHDVGELYLDPELMEPQGAPSSQALRQITVHPSVGAMLLRTLTDYPLVLQKAVAEHHERLDGTGYPLGDGAAPLSSLGRLLAVVEVVTGILDSDCPSLARAAIALRIVPGEFEPVWGDAIERLMRGTATAAHALPADLSPAGEPFDHLEARLREVTAKVAEAQGGPHSAAMGKLLTQAALGLSRLRVGWNSAGLSMPGATGAAAPADECAMAAGEIRHRLRALQRRLVMLGQALPEAEAEAVQRICGWLDP